MTTTRTEDIERAKTMFYAWRLPEAYQIFRRFFDRVPFKVEPAHAEYVGLFVRTLLELGKVGELSFYVKALSDIYESDKRPEVAYPLATVYFYSDDKHLERSKEIFEEIVRKFPHSIYACKSKIMLASYYNRRGDTESAAQVIDSVSDPSDLQLFQTLSIWRANVCRYRKKFSQGKQIIDEVYKTVGLKSNWYLFFSAKLIEGLIFADEHDYPRATAIVDEIKRLYQGRLFKSIQMQLSGFEKALLLSKKYGVLYFRKGPTGSKCEYGGHQLLLKKNSTHEKILELWSWNLSLSKSRIIESLYSRSYDSEIDDKVINTHIGSLKNELLELGLPEDFIQSDSGGFRFLPKIERINP